jgi:hypothetical protein
MKLKLSIGFVLLTFSFITLNFSHIQIVPKVKIPFEEITFKPIYIKVKIEKDSGLK